MRRHGCPDELMQRYRKVAESLDSPTVLQESISELEQLALQLGMESQCEVPQQGLDAARTLLDASGMLTSISTGSSAPPAAASAAPVNPAAAGNAPMDPADAGAATVNPASARLNPDVDGPLLALLQQLGLPDSTATLVQAPGTADTPKVRQLLIQATSVRAGKGVVSRSNRIA